MQGRFLIVACFFACLPMPAALAQAISYQLYDLAARQQAQSKFSDFTTLMQPATGPITLGTAGATTPSPGPYNFQFRPQAQILRAQSPSSPPSGAVIFGATPNTASQFQFQLPPESLAANLFKPGNQLKWSSAQPAQQFSLANGFLHGLDTPGMSLGDASQVFEQAADNNIFSVTDTVSKQQALKLAAEANQFGWTGDVDLDKASAYWEKAIADSSDADAMLGYSDFLATSKAPADVAKSRQLILSAAALKQPVAVLKSYDMARHGIPGFDLAESFAQLKASADGGDIASSIAVGDDFRSKASFDPAEATDAFRYYAKGLDDGIPMAKGRVGALMLQYGNLSQLPEAANLQPLALLSDAADAGDVDSLLALSERALKSPGDPLYNPQQAFNMASVASDFASPDQEAEAQADRISACQQSENCTTRPVFFATDRQMNKQPDGTVTFDNAPDPNHIMHLGVSYAVVWKSSAQTGGEAVQGLLTDLFKKALDAAMPGASESFAPPISSSQIPVKSVEIDKSPADFFSWVKAQEAGQPHAPDRVFAFVHGFATGFDDSARGAAQLAVNLDYPGIPIVLSWASRANLALYHPDSQTVTAACSEFQKVLVAIGNTFGFDKIDLLAHSMGSELTFAMLTGCQFIDSWPATAKVGNVVLAAPDVSDDTFATFFDQLKARSDHRTIYVSAHDAALAASATDVVNFGPRLGQGGDGRFVHDGVDTIDVTQIESGALPDDAGGHGYVYQRIQVADDLAQLFHEDFDLATRNCLQRGSTGNQPYMAVLEVCRAASP